MYTVTEQAGRDPTIGYSTQAYDVTVTVTDQGGMLSASVDRQPRTSDSTTRTR